VTSTSSLTDDPTIAVRSSLDAIDRLDSAIGAFVTLDENAERAAEDLRVESTQGHTRSALHGVPIGVKELFDVADTEVTYGSLVLTGRRATADAAIVAALRRAGAVVVGTTRSHEFGWGITTQNAERGSTRNPWDLDRIAGGSSGGSAAAVAAGMVPLAVASDTGGSIRIPASFCGVYGLKTTPGRISRTGGVPLAPSFDSPGFVTSDPMLLHAALTAVVGPDPADPPTLDAPTLEAAGGALAWRATSFAVADPPAGRQPDATRLAAAATVSEALVQLGARRLEVQLPDGQSLYETFVPLQMAEAYDVHASVLGTYPAQAATYGADVRGRLERAADVSISTYLDARRQAAAHRAKFLQAFGAVDLIVSLVGATGPTTTADPDVVHLDGTTVPLRDAVMPYTVPQNVAGLPSITVPVAFDADGLPIGVQLTGRPWSEPFLISVAVELQRCGAARSHTVPASPREG
jgi:aspartyl-tRNA(Asn)/glutamyl-tRNA(Gln) amidotransferase subunit A